MQHVPLKQIRIGRRFRKDLGDVRPLAESMDRIGLLHPVVVTVDYKLIAGRRRLEAARLLGWATIPVRIVDLKNIVEGELAENVHRKEFLPSELWAIAQKVKEIVRTPVGRPAKNMANCHNFGATRDKTAACFGISGRHLDKIGAICEGGFPDLIVEIDSEPRSVNRCFQKLKRLEVEREAGRNPQAARADGDQNILVGDMGLLWDRLEDESVDLFLSDPVYQDISAYERLAELAAAKLKPGRLCLAYTGHMRLPEILSAMGRHLGYWWTFAVNLADQPKAINARHVQSKWQPVVAFGRQPFKATPDWLADLLDGGGRDQTHHVWGKAESEVAYLIRRLTVPGALIVDPYCGGAAIPAAAKSTGRRWLATEINGATAAVARQRLAKMT